MASNDEPEQLKEDQNFGLKNVGKFWILKTNTFSKRLVFLDDAKDVKIDDNILIADERLFEIHKNEKGEYSFRHVEDITYNTYFSLEEGSCEQATANKDTSEVDESDYALIQDIRTEHKKASSRPENKDNYEKIDLDGVASGHFKLEYDYLPRSYNEMQHLKTKTNSSTVIQNCHGDSNNWSVGELKIGSGGDLNIGSVGELKIGSGSDLNVGFDLDLNIGSAAEMIEGHEKYDPVKVGSTEVDSVINDLDMTQIPSGGNEHDEFQVNIEHSKLTEMCAIEGEMILSIIDKTIIFKDINTGCVKNRFPFSLIRRFGIYGPCFFFPSWSRISEWSRGCVL